MRALLRPRKGALVTCVLVAALAWFQTDVTGLDRVVTVVLAFVLAYLAFNATAVLVERYA